MTMKSNLPVWITLLKMGNVCMMKVDTFESYGEVSDRQPRDL